MTETTGGTATSEEVYGARVGVVAFFTPDRTRCWEFYNEYSRAEVRRIQYRHPYVKGM